MGQVSEVPFIGKELNDVVFPLCLCLTVLITLVNGFNRVKRCCCRRSIAYVSSKNDDTKERIMDGKFLIEKFR